MTAPCKTGDRGMIVEFKSRVADLSDPGLFQDHCVNVFISNIIVG